MLRKAEWTSPPSNKMALATILIDNPPFGIPAYRTSRDLDQMKKMEDSDNESYIHYGEEGPSNPGYKIASSQMRSAYSRKSRAGHGFGVLKDRRFFCTYRHYGTQEPCHSWDDGYTTWHDLLRHADSEHGPEEVELIEKGLLSYQDAQWIRSEDHLAAIKKVKIEMSCEGCGMTFASNRTDSKERHLKRGACLRRQIRLSKLDVVDGSSYPKRKGGKTRPTHARR